MINTNQNMSIENAVKLLGIREIGTYPTPFGGEVRMFYQGEKVVVEHYDRFGESNGRYVYDSYDEACYESSACYY